jgi:asparagine synthetase B (glutamine-hydrolysing)
MPPFLVTRVEEKGVMCGIFFSLLPSTVSLSDSDRILFRNRGPDSYIEKYLTFKDFSAFLISSVLYLRGSQLVKQPLFSDQYIFQWNGEIFGGSINV